MNQGILNRWTSQYDLGITAGGLGRKLNILQISHHNSKKLSLYTSMSVTALRAWSILIFEMS